MESLNHTTKPTPQTKTNYHPLSVSGATKTGQPVLRAVCVHRSLPSLKKRISITQSDRTAAALSKTAAPTATAMPMTHTTSMPRSLNLEARLAAGFPSGPLDPQRPESTAQSFWTRWKPFWQRLATLLNQPDETREASPISSLTGRSRDVPACPDGASAGAAPSSAAAASVATPVAGSSRIWTRSSS